MGKMYTAYELAEYFGVTPATIYAWVEKGIPFHVEKSKNRYRMEFAPAECRKWAKESREKGLIK